MDDLITDCITSRVKLAMLAPLERDINESFCMEQ
jgi:hypothetical protein